MTIQEWKDDFKSFLKWLTMPRDDYNGIIAFIDEVPDDTANRWFSVKDRMPDNEQDVLAYLDDGEGTRVAPCNYVNGVWYDCVMNCVVILHHVTHWMPLPEPPKGG